MKEGSKNPQPSSYPLLETQQFVKGPDFTLTAMREGVVIGSCLRLRYVGRSTDRLMRLAFQRVEGGVLTGEETIGQIELFKRYEYSGSVPVRKFLLRAAMKENKDNRWISFSIGSSSTILPAHRSGLE